MYIIFKNEHCIFILSVIFSAKSKSAIHCACIKLCALVDHLSEKNWGFLMIFF
jgi:hypothetical protein